MSNKYYRQDEIKNAFDELKKETNQKNKLTGKKWEKIKSYELYWEKCGELKNRKLSFSFVKNYFEKFKKEFWKKLKINYVKNLNFNIFIKMLIYLGEEILATTIKYNPKIVLIYVEKVRLAEKNLFDFSLTIMHNEINLGGKDVKKHVKNMAETCKKEQPNWERIYKIISKKPQKKDESEKIWDPVTQGLQIKTKIMIETNKYDEKYKKLKKFYDCKILPGLKEGYEEIFKSTKFMEFIEYIKNYERTRNINKSNGKKLFE